MSRLPSREQRNQLKHVTLTDIYPSELTNHSGISERFICVLVGLPARGKTFTARKLLRYLTWLGFNARLFTTSSYRRDDIGTHPPPSFYDPHNGPAQGLRMKWLKEAINDACAFISENSGQIAILDGSNTSKERQIAIKDHVEALSQHSDAAIKVVWIEVCSNENEFVDANIREMLALSPDFVHSTEDSCFDEVYSRIKMYEPSYHSVANHLDDSFMILTNCGEQVHTNKMRGYILGRIVFFLMNLRASRSPIYFTRHGESIFNTENRIGGDSDLSPRGREYGKKLEGFMLNSTDIASNSEFKIWCSTLVRTISTARFLHGCTSSPVVQWRALSEIEAGSCDGLQYEEMQARFPEEFRARSKDKLRYRYPQGESYLDVIHRLESIIFGLERTTSPILVVSHRAVLRCLYAYFLDLPVSDVPHIDIPLHTVIKVTSYAYGSKVETCALGVSSVDDGTRLP